MTKILITGNNSFVGKNFIAFSKYKDIDEISLLQNKPEDIDFKGYNVVLHLAAIVHHSKKIAEEEYMIVNRDLCLRVAENAKKAGVNQFIFMSSLKVYGDGPDNSILRTENSECFPSDSYGRSKYAAEKGLKKLEDNNFIVSIIRTPLVYGVGVKANMYSLIKLIDKIPILPFAGMNNKRNFIYTENLVGFIDRIIEKNAAGIFIAKDDGALSITELAMHIAKSLNKKRIFFKLPTIVIRIGILIRPDKFQRLFGSLEVSNERTKEVLDFHPVVASEEGIKRMVNGYIIHKND